MKKMTKILCAVMALVLAVGVGVGGTLAWLKDSTETVVNTFTYGKLNITLDEADVDVYGQPTDQPRDMDNTYKLIPGHTYTKDPIVHFQPDSEEAYLFVKVDVHPGLMSVLETKHGASFSDGSMNTTIYDQIREHGWAQFKMVAGTQTAANAGEYTAKIYVKKVPANFTTEAVDYPVFDRFMVSTTDQATNSLAGLQGAKIEVTAYAVQADGFVDADAAWNATFGK